MLLCLGVNGRRPDMSKKASKSRSVLVTVGTTKFDDLIRSVNLATPRCHRAHSSGAATQLCATESRAQGPATGPRAHFRAPGSARTRCAHKPSSPTCLMRRAIDKQEFIAALKEKGYTHLEVQQGNGEYIPTIVEPKCEVQGIEIE